MTKASILILTSDPYLYPHRQVYPSLKLIINKCRLIFSDKMENTKISYMPYFVNSTYKYPEDVNLLASSPGPTGRPTWEPHPFRPFHKEFGALSSFLLLYWKCHKQELHLVYASRGLKSTVYRSRSRKLAEQAHFIHTQEEKTGSGTRPVIYFP